MKVIELVQIISALGAILTAFVLPIIMARMTAAKEAALAAKDAARVASVVAEKSQATTNEIKTQTEIIHAQTNSNLSDVRDKFEAFRRESNARDKELHDLILRLAERNTSMVGIPLGTADQIVIESITSKDPKVEQVSESVEQVADSITHEVAKGLDAALKEIKVETITTEAINVEPTKKKEGKE